MKNGVENMIEFMHVINARFYKPSNLKNCGANWNHVWMSLLNQFNMFNFYWWLIWSYADGHRLCELIDWNYYHIELVVGWPEVKLMSNSRLLWPVLRKGGDGVVIYCNHVDCESMGGLLNRFCQVKLWSVMNVLCATPVPLKIVKWFYVNDLQT